MRLNRTKTPLAAIAASAVLALGLAACGGDGDTGGAQGGTTTTMTGTAMDHSSMAPAAATQAVELRANLNRLLAEHAFLASLAMQKGHDGARDFDQVAGALEQNTVELGEAIGSVYGDEAETEFLRLWRQHIGFFVDYTTATAQDDDAGRREARQNLDGYRQAFATFLAGANPNLQADGVAGLLQSHVNQLANALDAHAAGNHQRAYAQIREGYAHMFMTGDGLSGAIVQQFPDRFGGDPSTDAADLRMNLNRLLGEHALLAHVAMQKGLDGARDFDQAAAALERNTVELGDAIGSVYGPEARRAFLAQWRAHIGFFVDYTTAVAGGDEEAQREALSNLDGYTEGFSRFLAGANPNLDAATLREGLQMHVAQLREAIDAYRAGEHETAYAKVREAYAHMWGTGDALSGAIVKQFPEKFGS